MREPTDDDPLGAMFKWNELIRTEDCFECEV